MRTWHIATVALAVCAWPMAAFSQEIVIVPDVVGLNEDEAKTRLQEAGIVGTVNVETTEPESCNREGLESGLVCGQSPAAGRKQLDDMEVWLSVQRGESTEMMPSLIGFSEPKARERLAMKGFTGKATAYGTTPDVRCETRNDLEKGRICDQDPAPGASVPLSADVAFLIQSERTLDDPSDYPPDIVGMSRTDAVAKLAERGFHWIELRFEDPDDQCAPGIVCRSNTGPNELHPRGSHVRVMMTVGGAQAASQAELESAGYRVGCGRMIDLIGVPAEEALMRLDLVGFRGAIIVGESEFIRGCDPNSGNVGANQICGQSLPVGEEVCSGTRLGLFVAAEIEPPQTPTADSPFGAKAQ